MTDTPGDLTRELADLVGQITPVDEAAGEAARERHAGLAKPARSLGRLETLGARLASVSGLCPPPVPSAPALIVAAGDHGVHGEGVTPWPQAITAIMTGVIADGRAASSVMADQLGVRVAVLDAGVLDDVADRPALHRAGVLTGATANLREADAMTRDEAAALVLAGAALAQQLLDDGADLLLTGDMGIANTTASAALVAAFTGASADEVTGRGTGIDDATLAVKAKVVDDALRRTDPSSRDALGALAGLGGAEHAALVGVILAGAAARVPVLLDGVIANAAALAAVALAPHTGGYLVAGHRSVEPGASRALAHLRLDPLVDLDLRLGEGTGALLAVPIVQCAARVLNDMATLADLGIT